jgi:hypothetical protein
MKHRLFVCLLMVAAAVTPFLFGCATAQEPWPNLNDAEGHLQAALEDLNRAPDRFGGHKGEAERLIQAAMSEIEAAKYSYR